MARTIVVAPGDTLSLIATTHYGSPDLAKQLATFNGISNPDLLQAGARLELPLRKELDGPWIKAPVHGFIKPPKGLYGIIRTFGDISSYISDDGQLKPEWEIHHLTTASLPFSIPLSWDSSQQIRRIYCHNLLAPIVSELFTKIDHHRLRSEIKSFGGCFNFRPKRQCSKLSTHSWGIAIDLNPETNHQGDAGDMHPELVALFREYGFIWGGDWQGKNRDPMHFQYCTGY